MSDKWVLVPVEPTPEMLEPMAREDCKHDGFDPDEPMPPHGHYPRWYDRCGPFAEIYRAMLAARPAAPAQEDDVERVARAIQKAESEPSMIECPGCNGRGYHHGFGEGGHSPDWCETCGGSQVVQDPLQAARAAIRALKRGEG